MSLSQINKFIIDMFKVNDRGMLIQICIPMSKKKYVHWEIGNILGTNSWQNVKSFKNAHPFRGFFNYVTCFSNSVSINDSSFTYVNNIATHVNWTFNCNAQDLDYILDSAHNFFDFDEQHKTPVVMNMFIDTNILTIVM